MPAPGRVGVFIVKYPLKLSRSIYPISGNGWPPTSEASHQHLLVVLVVSRLHEVPPLTRLLGRGQGVTARRVGLFAGPPAARADLLVNSRARGRRSGRQSLIIRHACTLSAAGLNFCPPGAYALTATYKAVSQRPIGRGSPNTTKYREWGGSFGTRPIGIGETITRRRRGMQPRTRWFF